LATNRLASLLDRKRRARAQILDLTESNPTRAGFVYPVDEIIGALNQTQSMFYEPAPRGLIVARGAVASYYLERGFELDPKYIHLTAGTSEGYAYLFKLLADQGQAVLVPQPSYPLFEFLAALEGVELRSYELNYIHPSGWQIDFDSIDRAVDANTRAVILVSPNNPTGSFIKKTELKKLNEICFRRRLALIVDEVFGDYAFDEDETRAASLVSNDSALTFVLSGFSKVLALPQMKLGWIATNGPAGLRDEAIERLDLIADTFLSVGSPVQHAARAWLQLRRGLQKQILDRVQGNLKSLATIADRSPCRLLKVEGGWYATLEVPRHFTEEDWALNLLERDNVLAYPGYFFDFQREAFLILSLLPQPEIFCEGINRLFERI
jgi:hypothetical protein